MTVSKRLSYSSQKSRWSHQEMTEEEKGETTKLDWEK